MPTILRRDPRACPKCGLPLVVLHTSEGKTVEYDITEWQRLCHDTASDSPLTCQWLKPHVAGWLDGAI